MRRTTRRGYTLFEIIVILALLILLGVAIIPTLTGFYGNTRQRAAADAIRSRLADARARAMEEGIPYRVALHEDKTRIRLAPDLEEYVGLAPDDPPAFNSKVIEDKLTPATAELVIEGGSDLVADPGGWITIAVFKPTGDCKEDRVVKIDVKERDFRPIRIEVRGMTGSTTVTPAPKGGL
jgi:type II secretory pathway pseudopilin PulG